MADTFADGRIQNLIITLDKIKYFLRRSKSEEPPLSLLNEEEVLDIFWKDYSIPKEHSILAEVFGLLNKFRQNKNVFYHTYFISFISPPSQLLSSLNFLVRTMSQDDQ